MPGLVRSAGQLSMNCKICSLLQQYDAAKGNNVSIVVIDSGVEASHPALATTFITGICITERFGQFKFSPYDGVDVAGHGTACAGRALSIAPAANIVSCRILNRSVKATSLALLEALKWTVQQETVGVVNLSLGTPNREFGLEIAEQIDALCARGVPVVVARGYDCHPDYPSCFSSPVSVVGEDCSSDDELVFYDNNVVEFGARGQNVEVAWAGGRYVTVSGSSFAAPLIAGRIARLKSLEPDIKVWDVKTMLTAQASRVKLSSEQSQAGSVAG